MKFAPINLYCVCEFDYTTFITVTLFAYTKWLCSLFFFAFSLFSKKYYAQWDSVLELKLLCIRFGSIIFSSWQFLWKSSEIRPTFYQCLNQINQCVSKVEQHYLNRCQLSIRWNSDSKEKSKKKKIPFTFNSTAISSKCSAKTNERTSI